MIYGVSIPCNIALIASELRIASHLINNYGMWRNRDSPRKGLLFCTLVLMYKEIIDRYRRMWYGQKLHSLQIALLYIYTIFYDLTFVHTDEPAYYSLRNCRPIFHSGENSESHSRASHPESKSSKHSCAVFEVNQAPYQ